MTRDEGGQALLEVMTLGMLFLVPLIWALGVLSELHRAALSSTAAAREAGFDAARATDDRAAARAVDAAVAAVFADHGLDPSEARVAWSGNGLTRGEPLEISISYPVTVVQAPFLARAGGPSIWVHARHVARIDPFRSR